MEKFEVAIDAELATLALGRGGFKAVSGEYGSGKTFFARWLQERARASHGFATSEVQVSETETPLHRWETVYRRLAERLATTDTPDGALRSIVDAWFYTLEEDVLASGKVDPGDAQGLLAATDALVEQRLSEISRTAPAFSAVFCSTTITCLAISNGRSPPSSSTTITSAIMRASTTSRRLTSTSGRDNPG